MAKINARGAHQVGPTLYTEYDRPPSYGDPARTYYEAWRLRSDGAIMTRIIRTWPTLRDSTEHRTEHRGSSFRIVAKIRKDCPIDIDVLRRHLENKGYRIVKDSWR